MSGLYKISFKLYIRLKYILIYSTLIYIMSGLTDKISNMLPKFSSFNGLLGNKPLETKHIIMIGLAILFVAGLVYLFINRGNQ